MKKTGLKAFLSASIALTALFNITADIANFKASAIDLTGTLFINEICAKNTTYAAKDGAFYDWIEIYNASSQTIDLGGFGLSDKSSEPYRYTFPQGTSITANSRLLIFCDSSAIFESDELLASFGLSTNGETVVLTNSVGTTVDSIEFGIMETDVTYGRYPDGSSTLAKMQPSPLSTNIAQDIVIDVEEPVFSAESGFYSSNFSLSITASQGHTIYYTTDGSDPTTSSNKYSSSIYVQNRDYNANVYSARTDISCDEVSAPKSNVDKATIIRAISVDENGYCSDIVTKTYFAGYDSNNKYYDDMRVISLVTDPSNLFDSTKGIYVKGDVYNNWRNSSSYDPNANAWEIPANYTQSGREWEREATMQIFENGQFTFSQDIGIRIHGGATRNNTQKSFNIYARSDYGTTKMEYAFYDNLYSEYDGSLIDEFDSIMLRNGGNDMQYIYYRDDMIQELSEGRDFVNQEQTPCIVFIDGEYWGLYYITEKISNDYIESHFNIKESNVAIVKNFELEEGEVENLDEFLELIDTITESDMSDEENYKIFTENFDVQSYIDYMCVNMHIANCDWPLNNWAVWRSNVIDQTNPYSDGKWRMIMYDTEYSTGLYEDTDANFNSFNHVADTNMNGLGTMLISLLENDEFKKQFAITYMDVANIDFKNDLVQSRINEHEAALSDMIYDTWERFYANWVGSSTSYAQKHRNTQLNILRTFFNNRFYNDMTILKDSIDLSTNMNTVTINANISEGKVKLNTAYPDISSGTWNGHYYNDYPLTLTAEPSGEAEFSHWEIIGGKLGYGNVATNLTISVDFSQNITINAVYGEHESTVFGDSNLNFCVDNNDFAALNAYLLSAESFNQNQYSLTDMNSDDTRNVVDLLIQKKSAVYGEEYEPSVDFDPTQYTNICPTNWYDYGISGDSAYSFSYSGHSFDITLSQTGDKTYSVQASTLGTFTLTQGKTYRVIFDAYSTVDRTIGMHIQGRNDYSVYQKSEDISLSAYTPTTYSLEFTMDQTKTDCYFNINFGYFSQDSSLGTHSVSIDNVYIVCVE